MRVSRLLLYFVHGLSMCCVEIGTASSVACKCTNAQSNVLCNSYSYSCNSFSALAIDTAIQDLSRAKVNLE